MPTTSPLGLRYPPSTGVTPNVPRDLQALAEDVQQALGSTTIGMQEGVTDAGAFEVTQASGGASMVLDVASNVGAGAYVADDGLSPARQALFYVGPTASKSTVTASAAHATLPRVDAIVLSLAGVVSLVAGTATAGATLDNARDGSHGGAAIPSDALHLADVLVPATDTTLANSQIRDRRKWARGAYQRLTEPGHSTTSSTLVEINNTQVRIECSGAPVRVAAAFAFSITVDKFVTFNLLVDGASQTAKITQGRGATGNFLQALWTVTPAAGSHVFSLAQASNDNTTLLATDVSEFVVEEIIRQNTANNTTTSG